MRRLPLKGRTAAAGTDRGSQRRPRAGARRWPPPLLGIAPRPQLRAAPSMLYDLSQHAGLRLPPDGVEQNTEPLELRCPGKH